MTVRSTAMTCALIVEDDPDFAAILAEILVDDVGVSEVVSASTLEIARESFEHHDISLVLLDLALPDGRGSTLIPDIPPDTCTVVISVFGSETAVVEAMSAGADGYLLKDDANIGTAIRAAMAGESPLSAPVASHLIASWRRLTGATDRRGDPSDDVPLSPREAEILQQFANGLSYVETADQLKISRHTVADHVKNIYRKLTVNSRASAVSKGLRKGLVHLPTNR